MGLVIKINFQKENILNIPLNMTVSKRTQSGNWWQTIEEVELNNFNMGHYV